MRIALFVTCVNDLVFPGTGRAVVRILERLGHTVEFPAEQSCCGQMHANSGYRAEAMPLVHRFVDTFTPYDAVVAPSGSCVAMVRESYPRLAAGDPAGAHEPLMHAQDIVLELQASLRADEFKGGYDLAALYGFLHRQLVLANIRKDAAITDEVLTLVTDLCDAWRQAALQCATEQSA